MNVSGTELTTNLPRPYDFLIFARAALPPPSCFRTRIAQRTPLGLVLSRRAPWTLVSQPSRFRPSPQLDRHIEERLPTLRDPSLVPMLAKHENTVQVQIRLLKQPLAFDRELAVLKASVHPVMQQGEIPDRRFCVFSTTDRIQSFGSRRAQ
jgi:hypothetical protein